MHDWGLTELMDETLKIFIWLNPLSIFLYFFFNCPFFPYFFPTDSCCRAHDLCPSSIHAQSDKFDLKNSGKFTRSHCDCDNEFYRCLKSANTLVSGQIGIIYFNVLGAQCFSEEHPARCTKYFRNRCVAYSYDDTQPKQYQWFDNKWY